MKNLKTINLPIIGAITGGLAASICCLGPLVLLMLGISGAWISTLTQLEFLRPIGMIVSFFFLGMAFWKLYMTPKTCSQNKPCINPKSLRLQRTIFWVIVLLLILLFSFPWYAPLFY